MHTLLCELASERERGREGKREGRINGRLCILDGCFDFPPFMWQQILHFYKKKKRSKQNHLPFWLFTAIYNPNNNGKRPKKRMIGYRMAAHIGRFKATNFSCFCPLPPFPLPIFLSFFGSSASPTTAPLPWFSSYLLFSKEATTYAKTLWVSSSFADTSNVLYICYFLSESSRQAGFGL